MGEEPLHCVSADMAFGGDVRSFCKMDELHLLMEKKRDFSRSAVLCLMKALWIDTGLCTAVGRHQAVKSES